MRASQVLSVSAGCACQSDDVMSAESLCTFCLSQNHSVAIFWT